MLLAIVSANISKRKTTCQVLSKFPSTDRLRHTRTEYCRPRYSILFYKRSQFPWSTIGWTISAASPPGNATAHLCTPSSISPFLWPVHSVSWFFCFNIMLNRIIDNLYLQNIHHPSPDQKCPFSPQNRLFLPLSRLPLPLPRNSPLKRQFGSLSFLAFYSSFS